MKLPRTISILLCALLAMTTTTSQAQGTKPAEGMPVSWPSVICKGQPVECGRYEATGRLFAQPGQSRVVLISHGSQGVDSRMYDYVDALKSENMAALVIDHWTGRGIDKTHEDYAAANVRGGNELNMVFDSFTAADWLRRQQGFDKVGSIGESQGASAAIMLEQQWARTVVDRNVARIYAKPGWKAPDLDAVVGLYGYCGIRVLQRDAFSSAPFLMVTAQRDDETPSRYCEAYIPYMNERGANARVAVMPGVFHSFDAPYRMHRSLGPHYANCDIVADGNETKEMNSGTTVPGTNVAAVMARCMSRGFTTGNSGDRFVAVRTWIDFFKEHL